MARLRARSILLQIALPLFWIAACAPPPARDITVESRIQGPAPDPAPVAPETSAERAILDTAMAQRRGGSWNDHALLAWLCPGVGDSNDARALSRCAPAQTSGAATGWMLVGELAFETDATNGVTLARAEVAYTKSLAKRPSRLSTEVVLYKRGFTRFRLAHFEDALVDFLEVLSRPPKDTSLAPEALEYAAQCIAEEDWDSDEQPDKLRGFDRPVVQARLPKDAPWLADLMVSVISALTDRTSPDARAALRALEARFPRDPRIAGLRKRVGLMSP